MSDGYVPDLARACAERTEDAEAAHWLRWLADGWEAERDKRERAEAVCDELRKHNESVAVCRKHIEDITADGCVVCDLEAAYSCMGRYREALERISEVDSRDRSVLGALVLCRGIAREVLQAAEKAEEE